jgi:hypothetical protein
MDVATDTQQVEVHSVTHQQIHVRAEAEFDKARRNFWAFRLAIHPELIKGWWPKEIAGHLQAFYKSLVAGERPKLAIAAPPQHGKSMAITDFIDPSPPVVLEVKIAERLTVLASAFAAETE